MAKQEVLIVGTEKQKVEKLAFYVQMEFKKEKILYNAQMRLTVKIWKDKEGSDYFISYCPSLNISSFGESPEHSLEMIEEAIKLFFSDCHEVKDLQELLVECGFKKHGNEYPEESVSKEITAEIPLEPVPS